MHKRTNGHLDPVTTHAHLSSHRQQSPPRSLSPTLGGQNLGCVMVLPRCCSNMPQRAISAPRCFGDRPPVPTLAGTSRRLSGLVTAMPSAASTPMPCPPPARFAPVPPCPSWQQPATICSLLLPSRQRSRDPLPEEQLPRSRQPATGRRRSGSLGHPPAHHTPKCCEYRCANWYSAQIWRPANQRPSSARCAAEAASWVANLTYTKPCTHSSRVGMQSRQVVESRRAMPRRGVRKITCVHDDLSLAPSEHGSQQIACTVAGPS